MKQVFSTAFFISSAAMVASDFQISVHRIPARAGNQNS